MPGSPCPSWQGQLVTSFSLCLFADHPKGKLRGNLMDKYFFFFFFFRERGTSLKGAHWQAKPVVSFLLP